MPRLYEWCLAAGFVLSAVGWAAGAGRFLGIRRCFVPSFVLSWMAVLVYFGGIAGQLYPAACVVYAGGLAVLALWLIARLRSGRPFFRLHVSLTDVCFLAGSVLFLSLLYGEHLQHYDNYSHWAVVVKVMLTNNAFPTASDRLIEFTNYPLGTSSLLYYAGRFLGHSEGVFLVMQGLLIFSLFYAVFGVIEKEKCFLLAAALGAGLSALSFFNLTIRINNLLVDFILPVLTLACWSVIIRFRREPSMQLMLLLPLQALLLITKSTGVIYVLFTAAAWCREALRVRDGGSRKHLFAAAETLAVSFYTYAAWKWHVSAAFADVKNKFSLSTSALQDSDAAKTPEELQAILTAFVNTATDITTRPVIGFLLGNLAAVGLYLVLRRYFHVKFRRTLCNLLLLDIMVIGYYVGILCLYLFSMPVDEALTLAGFERYASSIIVLFVGGVVLSFVSVLQEELACTEDGRVRFSVPEQKHSYQRAVLIGLILILLILTSEYNGIRSTDTSYASSLPAVMKSVTGDRWYANAGEDETDYLMYGSDRDGQMTSYYFQYLARYYLYAPNVDAVCVFYEPNLENLLSGYECLVVVEPDAAEKKMLKEHFGVDGEAGFYDIVTDGETVSLVKRQQ